MAVIVCQQGARAGVRVGGGVSESMQPLFGPSSVYQETREHQTRRIDRCSSSYRRFVYAVSAASGACWCAQNKSLSRSITVINRCHELMSRRVSS